MKDLQRRLVLLVSGILVAAAAFVSYRAGERFEHSLTEQRLGMTQVEFAEAFGLPVSTLRDWEQRRSTPDAPARALLRAIEREPETMRRLLSRAA